MSYCAVNQMVLDIGEPKIKTKKKNICLMNQKYKTLMPSFIPLILTGIETVFLLFYKNATNRIFYMKQFRERGILEKDKGKGYAISDIEKLKELQYK